jgi:hypothetical protein
MKQLFTISTIAILTTATSIALAQEPPAPTPAANVVTDPAATTVDPNVPPTIAAPRYEDCGELIVDQATRISLPANQKAAVRIEFPQNLKSLANSTPELWDAVSQESGDRYLWARPKTATKTGDTTSVTAVGLDGRTYDFLFQAVKDTPPTTCWAVVDNRPSQPVVDAQRALDSERARTAEERNRLAALMATIADKDRQATEQRKDIYRAINDQAQEQARDAIDAFKYTVYTAYDWSYSDDKPTVQVSAVYDDGRSTFIRIANDAFGLPVVVAINGEKPQVLTYEYDDLTGVYRLHGLHRQLELRFGNSKIVVRRAA